jgi:hypothetical protein
MDARNPGEIMDAVAHDARESGRQEPLYGGFTRFELEVEVSERPFQHDPTGAEMSCSSSSACRCLTNAIRALGCN